MQTPFTKAVAVESAAQAVITALLATALIALSFFAVEPRISHGQAATDDFIIRQTITSETSFLVTPPDVTMGGSIAGLSGGNATGTTSYVVRSNNASGYYVEIDFFDNAGAYAMRGDEDGGAQIRDYGGDSAGEPSYNLTASTAAQFAYSNYSSTTSDTDDSFLNNGSNACNQVAGSQTIGKCWKAPSTTGFRIVDRGTAAVYGATSTLYFRVHVPSSPNPIPTAQTYTATATLSVFVQ
ncbi:MAG: hypothetical protein AAB618_03565 [Patescibacteria group bacterium]